MGNNYPNYGMKKNIPYLLVVYLATYHFHFTYTFLRLHVFRLILYYHLSHSFFLSLVSEMRLWFEPQREKNLLTYGSSVNYASLGI